MTTRQDKKNFNVKRSRAGLGLFAVRDFRRGEFVVEYVGEMLTAKEADLRGGKYLFDVSSRRVVDGSPRWNIARYINHSCLPNCEPEIKRGKIKIYAKKGIKVGEELTYDYGREYFDEFIKPRGCRCEKCAG